MTERMYETRKRMRRERMVAGVAWVSKGCVRQFWSRGIVDLGCAPVEFADGVDINASL